MVGMPDVEPGLRPMAPADVAACETVWHDAFPPMRAAYHLPVRQVTEADRGRLRLRIASLCESDPGGAWVATSGDDVVGFAQALRRERLWVLSMLAVLPAHQGRGAGRALLEAALATADVDGPGMIQSSRDPRAMHRYVRAGFALHPAVAAVGALRRSALPSTSAVRPGTEADLELVAVVDRVVRGAPHGPELPRLLEEGERLLVVPGRGYAVARPTGVRAVGALDEEAAVALLAEVLAGPPPGTVVDVNWITGSQQWALSLCAALGLEIVPMGAVMVRGLPGPPVPYLPTGAYG